MFCAFTDETTFTLIFQPSIASHKNSWPPSVELVMKALFVDFEFHSYLERFPAEQRRANERLLFEHSVRVAVMHDFYSTLCESPLSTTPTAMWTFEALATPRATEITQDHQQAKVHIVLPASK